MSKTHSLAHDTGEIPKNEKIYPDKAVKFFI